LEKKIQKIKRKEKRKGRTVFLLLKHMPSDILRDNGMNALRERQVYTSKNYEAKWIGRNL
jgi:hydroxyacyl-ACP dehydratase HTD2-like protein with hotdog domain